MKISVDELREVGRWYLVVPPLLLVAFLAALFLLGADGQSRLEAANVRVHRSEIREQALNDYLELIAAAESGERGYLLSAEDSYLLPYRDAIAKLDGALDRLADAYRLSPAPLASVQRLRTLTREELEGLAQSLDEYRARAAVPGGAPRSNIEMKTSAEIVTLVNELRRIEIAELSTATARWQSDLRMTQWLTIVGAILNIGMVLVATGLVYADMRRRSRQATTLQDQKQELGRQVDERTQELTTLSTHLQGISEQEKSALSRELHDELGGLLVAARMDLSWLQNRLPTTDPAIEQRFKRIHECLSAGVDLKRRVVEELRPTLLDNMGLFTALRWQFKESCRRAGLICSENIPEVDLNFNPDAAIAVFRIAQEALTNILKHAEAESAELAIDLQGDTLVLRVSDDGKGIPAHRLKTSTSHGLASMRHRIQALGGTWSLVSPAEGGTIMTARIPLAKMLPLETVLPAIA